MQNAGAMAERLADEGIPFVWLTDGSAPPPSHGRTATVGKPVTSAKLVPALERTLSSGRGLPADSFYPVPPPQPVWPRVFPQL